MLRINRHTLMRTVEKASMALPGRTPQEVLYNTLLVFDGKWVSSTCTNHELRIRAFAPCDSPHREEYLVPASRLVKLLQTLPDDEIELGEEADSILIVSRTGRYNLPRFEVGTFPTGEQSPDELVATVPGKDLAEGCDQVAFAQSTETHKTYTINSSLWHFKGTTLALVATDCKVFAIAKLTCSPVANGDDWRLIVPPLAGSCVTRLLADHVAPVEVRTTKNGLRIVAEGVEITTSLTAGLFVKYESFFNHFPEAKADVRGTVLPDALRATVSRVEMVTSNQTTISADFEFTENAIIVSQRTDKGRATAEQMAACTGKECEVRFQLPSIKAALSKFKPGTPIPFFTAAIDFPLVLGDDRFRAGMMCSTKGDDEPEPAKKA